MAIFRAFPDDVRTAAVAAVKRRPRMVAVTAGVAAWTLVYALYSLAYPNSAAVLGAGGAAGAADVVTEVQAVSEASADRRDLLPPSLAGELALPPAATATVTPDTGTPAAPPAPASSDDAPSTTTAPPTTAAPPPSDEPEPEPCPFEAIAAAFGPEAAEVLCPEGSAP